MNRRRLNLVLAAAVGAVLLLPAVAGAQETPPQETPPEEAHPAPLQDQAQPPDSEPTYGAGGTPGATIVDQDPGAVAGDPIAPGDPAAPAETADTGDPTATGETDGIGPAALPAMISPYGDGFFDIGAPRPVVVGSGVDALLTGPPLRGDDNPTLLERFGAQGHSLDEQRAGASSTDRSLNAMAGWLFAVAAWLALAVTATVQWAFTVDLFSFLGDTVAAVVGAVRGTVYTPFVVAAIALAGVWAAWQGLVRRRGTRAFEGMAWTVGALVVAALFFASPGTIINGANAVSTEISRGALAAVAAADPKTGPADGVTTTASFSGHPADQQLRLAADRFWRVFVHQPWLVLQFGDATTGAVFAETLLEAKTIQPEEAAALAGDPEGMEALVASKQEAYLEVQEQILADPAAGEWFRGRRSVERVGIATLALVGVLLGGVLMALIAIALLLAQVGLLLLVLMAPVALLLGIHPGAGRVLAIRWAGLALGLLLKRVVLGVLLAVVLVVNGVLLDATYPLGWLVVMGLQSLVVAAAITYRAPLARLIGPTTFPVLAPATTAAPAAATGAARSPAPAASATGGLLRVTPITIRHRSSAARDRRPQSLTRAPAGTNGHRAADTPDVTDAPDEPTPTYRRVRRRARRLVHVGRIPPGELHAAESDRSTTARAKRNGHASADDPVDGAR